MSAHNIDLIFKILEKEVINYHVPVVDLIKLHSNDPYRILVATILSARTKDETTARAASRLFSRANNLSKLNMLSEKEISRLIYPVGFYKNKAKFLKNLPQVIKRKYHGKIPDTIDRLTSLPGVGRKTANLVLALAFDKDAICVDTHGHRIPNRLGWVKTKTPFETEKALTKLLPRKYWIMFNRIFVAFGQNTCKPIGPKCNACPINKYCSYYKINKKGIVKDE
ncbi:MAG: endonuclease III [archaeon]